MLAPLPLNQKGFVNPLRLSYSERIDSEGLASPGMSLDSAIAKIQRFLSELEAPFVGRREEALVTTLALITGEHAILIGEPGTAKSALVRRAAELLNAKFFKYLLTKYTEPSELFGPLDVNALLRGVYVRVTKDKLPEAEIAFLDEIFNANSAILNCLLSLMMERVIYDGYTEIKAKLWSLFSASNRVPEDPELEALYDRFLLRAYVKPLSQELWPRLLDASWKIERGEVSVSKPTMSMEDLRSINKLVLSVNLNNIKNHLIKLLLALESKGIHMSDRRKGKLLKVIAAHAIANGRTTATVEDLLVVKYVAPKTIEDFEKVSVILMDELKTKERVLRELSEIKANVKLAASKIRSLPPYDPRLIDYSRSLRNARNRIVSIVKDFEEDEEVRRVYSELLDDIDELLDVINSKLS
ncbi:MAG: AAA family ATPase [Acidilobaceae archaeon]